MRRIRGMLAFDDTDLHGCAPEISPAVASAVHTAREAKALSKPRPLSDQTRWMLAVRDDRDRAAFGRLFDFFAPRLKSVVMRGGMPADQAEDVVQDVMLTVWRKAASFDPARAQVSSWIYQIARNRQIDVIRRESRPVPEELATQTDDAPAADQALALDQEADRLRDALAALPENQRRMVEQAYLGDLTHVEIRMETGLPLGTIKSRIRLALEKLRHDLKELRAQ